MAEVTIIARIFDNVRSLVSFSPCQVRELQSEERKAIK